MIIAILLWIVIIVFGLVLILLFSNGAFTGAGATAMLACAAVIALCVNGLDRNEASQVCDAINNLGGQASFVSGKCLIKNDGGVPIDRESDRYVYFTQQ
ncbi:hypothetical protein pEaSNUABM37_00090 [Erwinia phage pEa_SNUABM_37]|nr:hypothetical protein pEaSNUABM37_00090 [Erwinia phage pEa_SNUABM_37]QXO10560.1 hypothetical protein pEaSNUABM48_00090 [Erwinia phage pEa_SNUABM_48]